MSGGWNTIESDPGVFTFLIENLGVKNVEFEEIATLDPDELRGIQPVYGVILLFKYPTDPAKAAPEKPLDGVFDPDADLFFAHQTITNVCATQALLSVLLNKADEVDIGDPLRDFLAFTMVLPPDVRGEALSNSDLIRGVHNSFARGNPFSEEPLQDAAAASASADDAFHFVAYTVLNGQLYELDGLQRAPISHGPCDAESFPDRITDVLCSRIDRYDEREIRFSLLAMCQDQRIGAAAAGDEATLEREEHKRRNWRFENALRRHNMVGFVGEVVKNVVRQKLRQGGETAVERWVEESLGRRRGADKTASGGGRTGGGAYLG